MQFSRRSLGKRIPAILRVPLFILLPLLLLGCSKPAVQSSADLTEIQELEGALTDLEGAYEKGEAPRFFSSLSPSFEEADRFRQKIESDFKNFPERHLSLVPQRIWIQQKEASVTLRWEGTWVPSAPRSPIRQGGTALFRFMKENERFRLVEIRGESPFGQQS